MYMSRCRSTRAITVALLLLPTVLPPSFADLAPARDRRDLTPARVLRRSSWLHDLAAPTVTGASAMAATPGWAREMPALTGHHRHDCFAFGPFSNMATLCDDCDWATTGNSPIDVNGGDNDSNTPHFDGPTRGGLSDRTAFVCGYTGPWGGSWRMPAELRAELTVLGVACETVSTFQGLNQLLRVSKTKSKGGTTSALNAVGHTKQWMFRLKHLGDSLRDLGLAWRNERALRTLLPRNATCPWVIDFDGNLHCNYNGSAVGSKLNQDELHGMGGYGPGEALPASAALCPPWMENELFLRKDVLWVSLDRAGHKIRSRGLHNATTTAAAMLPGVTRWPQCKRCLPPPLWSAPRRFLMSYQGNCQRGWFNSSRARPLLRRLFEEAGAQTDPRLHFKCSGRGNCRSPGVSLTDRCRLEQSAGFDRNFYAASLNTTFALVPHGDVPWSFRFSEVVAAGVIPVIVADGLDLPMSQLIRWEDAAIRISERALERMTSITELLDMLPTGARRQHMLRTVAAVGSHFFGGKDPVETHNQGLNEAIRRAIAEIGWTT